MKSLEKKRNLLVQVSWILLAVITLVLWPVVSHFQWHYSSGHLHGVPAWFIGLAVFILVGGCAKLITGTFRNGFAWLFSRPALRIALGCAALLVSAVVLFYSVEFWRGKRAWARVVTTAQARGESLDPAVLRPKEVPSDQDFGCVPVFDPLEQASVSAKIIQGPETNAALGLLTNVLQWSRRPDSIHFAPWMESKPTDLGMWLQECWKRHGTNEIPAGADRPVLAKAILDSLQPLNPIIDELRGYASRPYCRLPFNYDAPFLADNISEKTLLSLLRIFRIRASAELALQQTEAAFKDVHLLFRIADYLYQQPTLYYQGARAYAFADGLQPLWEGMSSRQWSPSHLKTFQDQLQSFNPIATYPEMNRLVAFGNALFIEAAIPTTMTSQVAMPGLSDEEQNNLRYLRLLYPAGWSLQDQAAIYQQWLEQTGDKNSPTQFSDFIGPQRNTFADLFASSDPFFLVFIVPKIRQMNEDLRKYLPFTESVARLAMLACALERYRLTSGQYPDSLSALVPQYIDEIPADPIDGSPLRYRLQEKTGFVLYSIGSNGKDDGGLPSPRRQNWEGKLQAELNLRVNDWTWPSPSTQK